MSKTITPLSRILLNAPTSMLLDFLATLKVAWRLGTTSSGGFRAEIHVNDLAFVGDHPHMPHHALVHAVTQFLMESGLDYHEYAKGDR